MDFRPMRRNRQELHYPYTRVAVLRMDIEHLSGKEAIELVRAQLSPC